MLKSKVDKDQNQLSTSYAHNSFYHSTDVNYERPTAPAFRIVNEIYDFREILSDSLRFSICAFALKDYK